MNRDLIPVYLIILVVLVEFARLYAQFQPKTFPALLLVLAASLVVGFFAAILFMLPVLAKMCGKEAEG